MNEDLQNLHDTLMAQHQALYKQLDDTTDSEVARTIVTEMQEILHRIDVVQGLLFRQSTAALVKRLEKVDDADAELTKALKSAASAADFVSGVSKFLRVVDSAIDLANTLATLAAGI